MTVPEKRDLNEANFVLRYKPFKNVCHTETTVNFKLHWTITLDKTGLCSYFKVHFVEHIKKKKKRNICDRLWEKGPLGSGDQFSVYCPFRKNSFCAFKCTLKHKRLIFLAEIIAF